MRSRIFFVAVSLFFVTMNVFLWRSEYATSALTASVPAEVIWEKVMTSPDDSWLEVRHRGVKLGRAHWRSRINEQVSDQKDPFTDMAAEGMVRQVTGYSLDFSGTVMLEELTRLGFDFGLTLDAERKWQHLSAKIIIKPFTVEAFVSATDQEVRIVTSEDESRKELVYPFADLRNPEKLLRDLGGPLLPVALGAFGPLRGDVSKAGEGLAWEARHDRLVVGRTELRVYRLTARLLGRYQAVLLVSPVGEILRVELPDDLVMVNDALVDF
jgi:hypothetical protein